MENIPDQINRVDKHLDTVRKDVAELRNAVDKANFELSYLKGYTSGLASAGQVKELKTLIETEFGKIHKAAMAVLFSLVIGLAFLLI